MHALRIPLLIAMAALVSAAEVVVVNAANPAAEITSDDLAAMLDGKKANWADGARVVLVTNPDSPTHEPFLKTYANKTPQQFATAWKKIVFTGKGSAPTVAKSDAEMIAAVQAQPGALGYLSEEAAKAAGATVKILPVK
jgi:ABC-type phosphate transport system substrate-binding protein